MTFDILTLFPGMFAGPVNFSILKRAQEKKLIEINFHNLRDFAVNERGSVDDRPYGGGAGMVMRIEPIFNALKEILNLKFEIFNLNSNFKFKIKNSKTILLDPRGQKFTQKKAKEYSKLDRLILVCGHYEGIDERVKKYLVDESISIGDYVLTGGEIPAMIIIDAVTRLIPGVLEKPEATEIETFSQKNYKEFPQYTRPEVFNGWKVPKILLSGHHTKIKNWREINTT